MVVDLTKQDKKGFNLSEKRKKLYEYLKEQFGNNSKIPDDILRVVKSQDKEFIKRLKDGAKLWHGTRLDNWLNEINKLAGEELIE